MKVKSIIKYCIIIIFLFIVFYLKYTGFSPKSEKILIRKGKSDVYPEFNKEITCITWDIGYGIFGEKSDFYKEGGKTEGSGLINEVRNNITDIANVLNNQNCDIIFLQNIDEKSKRSFSINQVEFFSNLSKVKNYSFSLNQDASYPFNIFKFIKSGDMILSKYIIEESKRLGVKSYKYNLFSNYMRKDGLHISKIPIYANKSKLVLINLNINPYQKEKIKEDIIKKAVTTASEEYSKNNYVIVAGGFAYQMNKGKENMASQFRIPFFDRNILEKGWILGIDERVPSKRLLNIPMENSKQNKFYYTDGFILSPNIEVKMISTLNYEFKNSSHNPVKLIFKLKSF